MTKTEIKTLGDAFAHILLSHAAHGLATSSLEGTGEITLRDGLIVGAAAVAARLKHAWILKREVLPQGWDDAAVDLLISREGNNDPHPIAGVELKWWRQLDAGNAANRRRDLVKDFVRAAALYTLVEDVSFVALLSTRGSWEATANTNGSDAEAMQKLSSSGVQKWNVSNLSDCASVRGSVNYLQNRVPICNIFHTELLSSCSLTMAGVEMAFAKVWTVKKPQRTRFLDADDIAELI